MKKYLCLLLITSSLSLTINLSAQKKRLKPIESPFTAAILAGGSLSQVNGDESQGFSKTGLYGGIRGVIRFSHKFQVIVEAIYSQKGSKLGRNIGYAPGDEEFIKVNYMDIPLLAKIYSQPKSEGTYIEGGLSFARQINVNIVQHENINQNRFIDYNKVVPNFNKNDLFAVVGCGIDFEKHYEIGYRFSFSLMPFYHDKNYTASNEQTSVPNPVFQLRNYMMTLFAAYRF